MVFTNQSAGPWWLDQSDLFIFFIIITGHENDDCRLATESGHGIEINEPGAYPTVCIEFTLDGLAVTTLYKSHMINEYEGVGSTAASFDAAPQVSCDPSMTSSLMTSSTDFIGGNDNRWIIITFIINSI